MTYVVVEGVLAVVVINAKHPSVVKVEREYTIHETLEEARAVAKVVAAFTGKAYYDYAYTPGT